MRFTFVSEHLKRIKSEGKVVSAYRKHVRWRMYGRALMGATRRSSSYEGGKGGKVRTRRCVLCVTSAAYFSEVDVNVSIKVRLRRGRDEVGFFLYFCSVELLLLLLLLQGSTLDCSTVDFKSDDLYW